MNKLFEKLNAWWSDLAVEERRTLSYALPVIGLLALFLFVVQPTWTYYQNVRTERQQLADDLQWLYEQGELVARTASACSGRRLLALQNQNMEEYLTNIARRSGARDIKLRRSAERYNASVDAMPASRALGLVQNLACQGFTIGDLTIELSKQDASQVSFAATLTPAPYLAVR